MTFEHVTRAGTYYRVCDPSWIECADTTYSKHYGGRWNVPGAFGALYLNATISTAVANARRALRSQFGDAVTFDDLQDVARPHLIHFTIQAHDFVDAVTDAGLTVMGLGTDYPEAREHTRCREIAAIAWKAGEAGIAARSAVLPSDAELAIFDSHLELQQMEQRQAFTDWYPGAG